MEPFDNDMRATPAASTQPGVDAGSMVAEALAKTTVCVRHVGVYGRLHPMAEEAARSAHQAIAELQIVHPTVEVAVLDDCLAVGSFPLDDRHGGLSSLAKLLQERRVGQFSLKAGISLDEVLDFAEALSLSQGDLMLRGGLQAELERRNVVHVTATAGTSLTQAREGRDAADIYEEALILVEEAMRAIQSGLDIPALEIRAVVAESMQSLIGDETALLALAGVRSYDRYLSEHSVNVCILSMILGRELGMDANYALELGIAALLHDAGKVFVPGEVVRKPGRLSESEWELMRRHPIDGARALAGLPDLPALVSTIAMEHHVHCDGTGYPSVPSAHKPHLLSRLVSVVDTYDALTTERPYRERWTPTKAIAWMLYDAWRQYDRGILARLGSKAGLYPLGSVVRLFRGDLAVVIKASFEQPLKPTLKLVELVRGKWTESEMIDLSKADDPSLRIKDMAQPVEALLPYTDGLLAA